MVIRRALAFAAFLLVSTSVFAQATRTWVSGVGDDANPCSRTAPCKTFAGAISKTASGGIINVLDPGGFGAVTITKSITIDGTPFLAGVLAGGTGAIVINAASTDTITLRNLDIEYSSTTVGAFRGIKVIQAGNVFIDRCRIFGFPDRGLSVEPSSSTAMDVYVTNSVIYANQGGIYFAPVSGATPAIKASIDNSEIYDNFKSGSPAGISATSVQLAVVDSVISGHYYGVTLSGSGTVNLIRTTITNNGTGLLTAFGSVTMRLEGVSLLSNPTAGYNISSGQIETFMNNAIFGNGPSVGSLSGRTHQ